MSTNSKSLIKGSIGKSLFLFALPLFGSSLIQQLYNTVDLIFIGKFLGKEASAAVGAGGLLITCMLGFFTGLSVGISVIVGKTFGAGDEKKLDKIVHTAAGVALAGAAVFVVIGWVFTPTFLGWLNTPDHIMELATVYMRIYFLSLLSIISYNFSSGILRALGNSRSPMIYQLMGGIANVFGDAFFIYILKMGVRGAACATLLSQSAAAILTVAHLYRMKTSYRLQIKKICIEFPIFREILYIGIPSAVQSMIITFSNLIVQSQINSLGVDSIAAFTAYFRVELFIYLPILAFGQAVTTFVSQNVGAGSIDRAKKGTWTTIGMGTAVTLVMSAICIIFGTPIFGMFTNDPTVVEIGKAVSRITFPLYFIYVFMEVFASSIRGAGQAVPPMMIIVFNMSVVRVICLKIAMNLWHSAPGIAVIYPITWGMAAILLFIYYESGRWIPKNMKK